MALESSEWGGSLTTIRPMTVMPNYRCLFGLLISFGVVLFAGCDLWDKMMGKKEAESEVRRPVISVETMRPLCRDVVDYEEFTGDTNAVNDVTLQAQVSGILTKCDFAEGAFVKKDDVLFEIEPEVYKAALDTAVGNLESVRGELAVLKAREPQLRIELDRNFKLVQSNAVSKSDYDEAKAAHDECLAKITKAEADILKATAEAQQASINLKYTKILSPIDGYISRKLVTEGNLIQDHKTELAQIVSHDPIYVFFYVDETTFLKLIENAKNQVAAGGNPEELKIEFRLTSEESWTDDAGNPLHAGSVRYADPQMDESSGTVLLRATCPNPPVVDGGISEIIPGMMVHIRIPVTGRYSALLVPEEAFGTEQGTRVLYVKDSEGKARVRRPELGPLQEDNMRVVRSGIEADDEVIVSGLLRLRPDAEVEAKETTFEKLRRGM